VAKTLGEVNGVKSILHPFYCNKEKGNTLSGRYAVSAKERGRSWAIVPRWGHGNRESCLPGDSGSIVLQDLTFTGDDGTDAEWVGLLFSHEHGTTSHK
jgi:hypothetical protein